MKRKEKDIVNNGFKKVLENHTQKQRVEFIINKYKEFRNEEI